MALLAFWVLPVDPFWAKIAVVCAALPLGATAFVLAQRYKLLEAETSTGAVISTLVSVLTVSLVMALLARLARRRERARRARLRGPRRRRSGGGSSCRRRRSAYRRFAAHRGQQRQLGHLHRNVVVLGLVAEAARHAAAARSAPSRPSAPEPCRAPSPPPASTSNAFWWQWPCSSTSCSVALELQLARLRCARNSSNRKALASPARRRPAHRRRTRRAARTGTTARARRSARPRSTYGASASSMRRASRFASSTSPAARNVRPQHSGAVAARCTAVARRLEHLQRRARVLRLEVAVEGVDEQHDVAVASFLSSREDSRCATSAAPAAARSRATPLSSALTQHSTAARARAAQGA